MKTAQELISPPREFRRVATSHRLSWFATMHGLLFLSFALIDKTRNPVLTYLLVSTGVAICLPSIVYVDALSKPNSPVPFLAALCWTAIGAGCFVMQVT